MNRREMIVVTGLGAAGFAVGTGSSAPTCDKKSTSFYIATVSGALEALKPILPGQVGLLSKGISIAKTFDEAYKAGKFEDAMGVFENLTGVINDVIAAVGINTSPQVKVILTIAGVGIRTVAVLLKGQADEDAKVAAVVSTKTDAVSVRRRKLVESLADAGEINALFQAAKP